MSRLITFLTTLFIAGLAFAGEAPTDAPIPEDNWMGIIIFLVLMVGGGIWFFWKIMRNDSKAKQ